MPWNSFTLHPIMVLNVAFLFQKIINMDTFEALPMDSRRHLLSLLPIHDQTPPPNATALAKDADYWIHPTALNNEFLSKALQDYSIRQMNGEFSPRLNSRTGLRKSVGNRQRYLSPAVSPVPIPHSSTPLLQSSANTTKEEPSSTPLIVSSLFISSVCYMVCVHFRPCFLS